jgi:hypothetical protein
VCSSVEYSEGVMLGVAGWNVVCSSVECCEGEMLCVAGWNVMCSRVEYCMLQGGGELSVCLLHYELPVKASVTERKQVLTTALCTLTQLSTSLTLDDKVLVACR